MEYHFKIHKEKKQYWAECVEIPYCHTIGKDLEELNKNMTEVINLVLDEPENSKVILPLPKKVRAKNIIAVKPDIQIAFAMILRQFRLTQGLSQRQMAQKLGRVLSQYQKLEKSKTANPNLKTIKNLKSKFPELNLADIF